MTIVMPTTISATPGVCDAGGIGAVPEYRQLERYVLHLRSGPLASGRISLVHDNQIDALATGI